MPGKRPNILWICTDQQRFDTLGCYGNALVHTPNVDALASTGVLFESAYCQSTVCTPSRASFLTGRYPRTTRCRQNGQSIPSDEVLVTRLLAEAGTTCGLSGKLHISVCNPGAAPVRERRINDGYSVFNWSHHPHIASDKGNWPTNEYNLWLMEKGVEYKITPLPQSQYVRIGMPGEFHQTTWCADRAIAFMQYASRFDRPWLFSVNTFDPHHPFDPPEEFLRPYLERLDEIPLPNYVEGELECKPSWQNVDHNGASGGRGMAFTKMSARDHRVCRAAYWAMTDLIDRQVGRMLDALDRTGQLENTIVIFMSDHGEMLGDHGIYLKGPHFYEPAVHVPLIVSWPGRIAGGRRSTALVELTDLAPTLLEAVNLPRHPGMQGRSLLSLLDGKAELNRHRDDVYCEFYNASSKYGEQAFATMVRDDKSKIVVFHGCEIGELYDLERDPAETKNLWADPAAAPLKLRLLKLTCDRMARTVDPLPPREAVW